MKPRLIAYTTLKMVASTLMGNLRISDVIGRWGGEEFVAILYDTEDLNASKLITEKLRKLVENSRLDLGGEALSQSPYLLEQL